MKTGLAVGALALVTSGVLACKTQPFCDPLGACGGDLMASATKLKGPGTLAKEWVVVGEVNNVLTGAACMDQLQTPPTPLSLVRQPPPPANTRPPDPVTANWCSDIVFKADGSLKSFLLWAPPIPVQVGRLTMLADYDGATDRGTYTMQFTYRQSRPIEFSEACLTAQGVRVSCPELGRSLSEFTKREANLYNMRCQDAPGNLGGCVCNYEQSFIGGPNGRWFADSKSGQINFFSDEYAPPATADYCTDGKTLDLTGHDFTALFNQRALRTLHFQQPSCTDGDQSISLGEEGIDCGGVCPIKCGSCTNGVHDANEEGVDCGGACLNGIGTSISVLCDPDPAITDPTKRLPACANGKADPWEEGVDCGSYCTNRKGTPILCDPDPTITNPSKRLPVCSDGKKDSDETGVDCGGSCENADGSPKLCPTP
jgi:hypothetical protein